MLNKEVKGKPSIRYRIWEHPVDGCYYAIGKDPAGPGEKGSQGAARVWKDRPRALVAEAVGVASEEVWASELYKLGRYYNDAHIDIEVFRYGGTMLTLLLTGSDVYDIEPYPSIYRSPSTADLQAGIHRPTGAYGWRADTLRRPIMLSFARRALQYACENPGSMPDALGLREYYNVVWINGSPRAAPGERDDRVIADALAWLIFEQNPFSYEKEQATELKKPMFYVEDDKIMFNPRAKPKKKQTEGRLFE